MYADFSMTDTGDILITEDNPNKELKISFLYSKNKGQKISFYIRGLASEKNIDNRTLKVSFDIFNKTNEIKFKTKKGIEELGQYIYIQLKDTLGEIEEDSEDGSQLSYFIHENINESSLKALKIYLENFLSNIITNPRVELTPIIDYKNGYKQTVQINIFAGNSFLLEYNIER